MADGTFPSLVSKDLNLNAADNAMFVQLSDGTSVLGVTGDALHVNLQNASIAVTATDLDIRDLSNASDDVLVYGWDGASNQKIKTDANGELQVDVLTMPTVELSGAYDDDSPFSIGTGSDKVLAIGGIVDETATDSIDEGDVGAVRMTADRKLLTRIAGSTDANRLEVNASGEASISLENVDPSVILQVSKDTNANSETNPIYVQTVNTAISATEVHDFDQAVAVAGLGTSNHDYTVTGTTFLLKSVIIAASGNAKFEIQTGPVGSLVTRAVGFLTGKEGDTKQVNFEPAIEVPVASTGTVRVIRTNRQNQAQDLYSTIIGNDI